MSISVRKAIPQDVETIHKFIYELAAFEKLSEQCTISIDALKDMMFEEKALRAVIAEEDGVAVGMATYYFFKIATFSGKKVLYIEDLYITESARGKGYGTQIFDFLRGISKDKNCSRMEWKCLDWNSPTIAFYEKMGGKLSDGWLVYTLDEEFF